MINHPPASPRHLVPRPTQPPTRRHPIPARSRPENREFHRNSPLPTPNPGALAKLPSFSPSPSLEFRLQAASRGAGGGADAERGASGSFQRSKTNNPGKCATQNLPPIFPPVHRIHPSLRPMRNLAHNMFIQRLAPAPPRRPANDCLRAIGVPPLFHQVPDGHPASVPSDSPPAPTPNPHAHNFSASPPENASRTFSRAMIKLCSWLTRDSEMLNALLISSIVISS